MIVESKFDKYKIIKRLFLDIFIVKKVQKFMLVDVDKFMSVIGQKCDCFFSHPIKIKQIHDICSVLPQQFLLAVAFPSSCLPTLTIEELNKVIDIS